MSAYRRLIIAGAGGFGREIAQWARDAGWNWNDVFFLEDGQPAGLLKGFIDYPPVLGRIDDYSPEMGDEVLISIGDPRTRLSVYKRLAKKGAWFGKLVHPSSVVAGTAWLGDGVVICPQVTICPNSQVRAQVHLNIGAIVGHDARVGEFSTISPQASLMGWTEAGSCAFLGAGATVLPRIKIGQYARVAAGAVAALNVPDWMTLYAAPPTLMDKRRPELKDESVSSSHASDCAIWTAVDYSCTCHKGYKPPVTVEHAQRFETYVEKMKDHAVGCDAWRGEGCLCTCGLVTAAHYPVGGGHAALFETNLSETHATREKQHDAGCDVWKGWEYPCTCGKDARVES